MTSNSRGALHPGLAERPADVTASIYRTDKNTIASTTSQPTMTNEATAPAVILTFSLVV
jgi:hypothetical protein